MSSEFVQDHYVERFAHCYGCGYLNRHGLHVKSTWEGDEAVCRFEPASYHTAFPGVVYGGLIASIIDCHSIGAAVSAWTRAQGIELGDEPLIPFVTGRLEVDYLEPTPIDGVLEVRSRVVDIGTKKVIVESVLSVRGETCARGRVVAVKIPDRLL